MNSIKVLGKYLDQPKFVEKFSKAVPAILIGGGGIYGVYHVSKTPKKKQNKEAIKTFSVITATVISALFAPKIAAKIVKSHEHHHEVDTKALVDDFVKNNEVSDEVKKILEEAKTKILYPNKIKKVFDELENNPKAKEFLSGDEGLIPDPENIDSKHILGEIGKFSIIGGISVLGGIAGGIFGDKLTEKNWKSKIPDKIKEGAYQYLANIFLCNVGAGVALGIMEKANIKNKGARAAGMIGGILLTGVVFGSAMANIIGNKIINPLMGKANPKEKLYEERTPELLDIGLHIDDVATVGVLSGLKWIEPALPILYSVSGYRAGIGYRNGSHSHH